MVSPVDLSFDIGGSGFVLRLNPDFTSPNAPTVFSIDFESKWGILKYIKAFDQANFTGSTQDFFNLFLTIIGLDLEELIAIALETIIGADDDPLNDFAVDLNNNHGTSISLP